MKSQQPAFFSVTMVFSFLKRLKVRGSFGKMPVILLIAGGALTGCSGNGTPAGPNGITLEDLADTWNATHFEFSQAEAGPGLPTFDVVAEGGSVTLEVQSNGRFMLATVYPDGSTESQSGKLGFDSEEEDFLLVVFDDESDDELEFFFVIENDDSFRLIDNTGEGEFDLDGDGVPDRARINSTWVRVQ